VVSILKYLSRLFLGHQLETVLFSIQDFKASIMNRTQAFELFFNGKNARKETKNQRQESTVDQLTFGTGFLAVFTVNSSQNVSKEYPLVTHFLYYSLGGKHQ